MPLVTLRPNATFRNGAETTVVGAASRHAALSDDSDASYVVFATDANGNPPTPSMALELDDMSPLGPDQRIKQLRLRHLSRLMPGVFPAQVRNQLTNVPGTSDIIHDYTETNQTPTMRFSGWRTPDTLLTPSNIASARYVVRLDSGVIFISQVSILRSVEGYLDLDVQERLEIVTLEVRDGAGVDQCDGTVSDTATPHITGTAQYGYAGAPNQNVPTTQQLRIFREAQTLAFGFDPWTTVEIPVHELVNQPANSPAQGVAYPFGEVNPGFQPTLDNDNYVAYMRIGTRDFLSQGVGVWWSETAECSWTQDLPGPDAPSVVCTAESCPPQVTLEVTHDPSGDVQWDDPDITRVQVQVSTDGGGTWSDVISPDNGQVIAEGQTETVVDRFVAPSSDGSGCDTTPTERPYIYRARLYGTIDDGISVDTDWALCPDPTPGSITEDTWDTAESATSGTAVSVAHTTASGLDLALLAFVSWRQPDASANVTVTFSGETLTQIGGTVENGQLRAGWFVLLDPPESTAGTVLATFDETVITRAIAAATYAGVDDVMVAASADGGTTAVSVPSSAQQAASKLLAGVVAGGDVSNVVAGADMTERAETVSTGDGATQWVGDRDTTDPGPYSVTATLGDTPSGGWVGLVVEVSPVSTTVDTITIERCTDGPCLSWLIHPFDAALDWSGGVQSWTWTTTRPYSATQPAAGGLPTVVTGEPGGRDHSLALVALSTPEADELADTLAAPVLWYIPDDAELPPIWVAPGPDTVHDPRFIPSDEGAIHIVNVVVVETGPPPVVLPDVEFTPGGSS